MLPPNACEDKPRITDFKASELMWEVGTKRDVSFPKERLAIFNQWADKDTEMSCSRQWMGNITNGNNLIAQDTQDPLLAKTKWIEAYIKNPQIKVQWDYLQNALDQFLEDKLIAGYYIVSGKQEHMDAIDKGHYIYSWSNNGDWTSVRDKKLYAIKTPSSGHAFVKGVEYNDIWMTSINSYGANNGFFTLPWELCDTTFTSYAIIDFVDEEAILAYKLKRKSMEEIQEAKDLWLFNGENLDIPVTRGECARMVLRAYKLSK